jgi:hypothetical protein
VTDLVSMPNEEHDGSPEPVRCAGPPPAGVRHGIDATTLMSVLGGLSAPPHLIARCVEQLPDNRNPFRCRQSACVAPCDFARSRRDQCRATMQHRQLHVAEYQAASFYDSYLLPHAIQPTMPTFYSRQDRPVTT